MSAARFCCGKCSSHVWLRKQRRFHRLLFAFLLYVGCPITSWVSGFHGNVDAVMMFFLLLSLFLLQSQRAAWLVGVAF